MTDEDKIQYWLNLSDNDLKVAGAMLQGKFYLYVAFTGIGKTTKSGAM